MPSNNSKYTEDIREDRKVYSGKREISDKSFGRDGDRQEHDLPLGKRLPEENRQLGLKNTR